MSNPLKEEIQKLVGAAKLDKALDQLDIWADSIKDKELENQVIMLRSQYNETRRNELSGILTSSESRVQRAKIANGILSLIPDDDEVSVVVKPSETKPKETVIIETPPSNVPFKVKASSGRSKPTVLFLAANPTSEAKLQLQAEYDQVQRIAQLKYEVNHLQALKVNELQMSIFRFKPNIIHFSGHGVGKMAAGKRAIGLEEEEVKKEPTIGIVLEDEQKKAVIVRTEALGRMFAFFQSQGINIDVILLNACYSATQAPILQKYCKYMIGMTDAIGDDDAIGFARSFYEWMVELEGDVEGAFQSAVINLDLNNYEDADLPKLYKN